MRENKTKQIKQSKQSKQTNNNNKHENKSKEKEPKGVKSSIRNPLQQECNMECRALGHSKWSVSLTSRLSVAAWVEKLDM